MVWRKWLHLVGYLIEYLSEIALHVLHNHEQVRELEGWLFLLALVLANDYVIELSGKFVTLHLWEMSQYLYFADYLTYLIWTRKNVFNKFDGHDRVGSLLSGLNDLAKGSNSYKLKNLVVFFNIFPKTAELKVLHCYNDFIYL